MSAPAACVPRRSSACNPRRTRTRRSLHLCLVGTTVRSAALFVLPFGHDPCLRFTVFVRRRAAFLFCLTDARRGASGEPMTAFCFAAGRRGQATFCRGRRLYRFWWQYRSWRQYRFWWQFRFWWRYRLLCRYRSVAPLRIRPAHGAGATRRGAPRRAGRAASRRCRTGGARRTWR